LKTLVVFVPLILLSIATCFADIPWAEVKVRLARENELLARRPQGHAGTYFVICTLYYTPMESGFTAQRGFDGTPVAAPGLRARRYPREFLAAVRKKDSDASRRRSMVSNTSATMAGVRIASPRIPLVAARISLSRVHRRRREKANTVSPMAPS